MGAKFDTIFESAFNRYVQGSGFLAGDIVKFRKKVLKSEWFLKKGEAAQELIRKFMSTEGNLRIGCLKTEHTSRFDGAAAFGDNNTNSSLADIYLEISPANWAYPMTVPLEFLEIMEPNGNTLGGPVPDNVKDRMRMQIKGRKKGNASDLQAKQTKVDDAQRQKQSTNTPGLNAKKWDDNKVGGGNAKQSMPNESVSIEDVYSQLLKEDNQDIDSGGSDDEETETSDETNTGGSEGDSEGDSGGMVAEDENVDVATDNPNGGIGLVDEVDEYNQHTVEPDGQGVTVNFKDEVYSTIIDGEIKVNVIAKFKQAEPGGVASYMNTWDLVSLNAHDDKGRPVKLHGKDQDYLESRAYDFVKDYTPQVISPNIDNIPVTESVGTDVNIEVGQHKIRINDKTTGGPDPTQIETFYFDNGYQIVQFFGDYELKDPSGKRIKFVSKASDLNQSLNHLGLPLMHDIEEEYYKHKASNEPSDEDNYYARLMGDANP